MPLTMTQDFKLGFRMLLKYPGLTLAGGLALAIAIGVGAGWYQVWGNILSPTIPLPEGDRLVLVQTRNTLTNQPELRVAHDFLGWRRDLQTIEELGGYRTGISSLIVGTAPPMAIRSAEMTPGAFRTARVAPALGRGLQDADAMPGAPAVVVLGYDLWQRSLSGRPDVVGLIAMLSGTPATVIGVMPEGFAYPYNQQAWAPLQLRASYGPLQGAPLSIIGRLAPGVTREEADAELRVLGERAASAFPDTHAQLRSRVMPLSGDDINRSALLTTRNMPVLLVLLVACMNVGTLIYARTATREGEIAVRSALGASRARIVGQLFVEALLLALVSAAIGLLTADRAIRFGLDLVSDRFNAAPFWSIRGLVFTTILYACGLAVAGAAMLSLLPALRATRTHLQSHLANLGAGGATLRFGRVWTGMMIAQVALAAIGIPVALTAADAVARTVSIRNEFPSTDFVTAGIDLYRSTDEAIDAPAFQGRRAQVYAELERRLMQAPETVAVTFATYVPGASPEGLAQPVDIEPTEGAPAFGATVSAPAVGPRFFETIGRPIVAGRDFQEGDRTGRARTVVVNEAFARLFQRNTGQGSPIGARVRRRARASGQETAPEPWYQIVGVARDIGLDPYNDDYGEAPYVYHTASPTTSAPLMTLIRVRGNAGGLAARLPVIAAAVDPGLSVPQALPLNDIVRLRDMTGVVLVGSLGGVTLLVLAMSAMGIFSLMSVSVSRRTREIGLRTALGANPRQVVVSVLSRAAILMASGGAGGGALLLWIVSLRGASGRPADDIAPYVPWLAVTALVMLATGVLAALGPARRALRINPTDALRDA
ncbi:MAG TPA: FtsX-like permease family protein [Vicinamibacterales bacterium]|nr:FtsX-like permease family protein [Vicinamibacterales bacterium]